MSPAPENPSSTSTSTEAKAGEATQLAARPKATQPIATASEDKMVVYRRMIQQRQEKEIRERKAVERAAKRAAHKPPQRPIGEQVLTMEEAQLFVDEFHLRVKWEEEDMLLEAEEAVRNKCALAPYQEVLLQQKADPKSEPPRNTKIQERQPGLPFFLRALGYFDEKNDGPMKENEKWEHKWKWERCYHAYCPLGTDFAELRFLDFLRKSRRELDAKIPAAKKDGSASKDKKSLLETLGASQLTIVTVTDPKGTQSDSPNDQDGPWVVEGEEGRYVTANLYDWFTEEGLYVMDPDFVVAVKELTDKQVTDLLRRVVLGDFDWSKLFTIVNSTRGWSHQALTEVELKTWKDYYSDIIKVREDPERFEQSMNAPNGIDHMRVFLNNLLLWIMAIDQRWGVPEVDDIFKALKAPFLTLIFDGISPCNGMPGYFTVELNMTKDRFRWREERMKLEAATKNKSKKTDK